MSRHSRPSLADVARKAGVSPALASLALRHKPGPSEASRRAVLLAADSLGYRVNTMASLLAKNRTHLIGAALNLSQSFHVEAIDHVYQVAEDMGYNVLLSAVTASMPLDRAAAALISGSCEGVLIVGMHSVPPLLLTPPTDIPVAVIGHALSDGTFDVVRTAGDVGVREAVDHLAALGHTRIAHIDGGERSGSDERRRGYVAGMTSHGWERLIRVCPGGNSEEDGLAGARTLLRDDPSLTAIICYNDSCAIGAFQAAHEAGLRIPEDLSIVGYDNTPIAQTSHFDLTTVAQDIPRLTAIAVRQLIASIEDPGRARGETVLPPHLIVRSTTGPARLAPAEG